MSAVIDMNWSDESRNSSVDTSSYVTQLLVRAALPSQTSGCVYWFLMLVILFLPPANKSPPESWRKMHQGSVSIEKNPKFSGDGARLGHEILAVRLQYISIPK